MASQNPDQPQLTLNLNFNAPIELFRCSLGNTIQRVLLGLAAIKQNAPIDLNLPEIFFKYEIGHPPTDAPAQREDFKSWLVGLGLRELITSLEQPFIEIRILAGLCASMDGNSMSCPIKGTAIDLINFLRDREGRAFSQKTWPQRINELQTAYNIFSPLADEFLTINAARNCLTHRSGIVQEKDTNDQNKSSLIVRYRIMELFKETVDGKQMSICHNEVVEAGTKVGIRVNVVNQKVFAIGSRILFDPQEFVHLAGTIDAFLIQLSQGARKFAESRLEELKCHAHTNKKMGRPDQS